jgi:hypothetical protein
MSGTTTIDLRPPALKRAMRRGVLWVAVLFAAMFAWTTVWEMATAPWARSLGLWATLTGDWHGEIRMPGGVTQPVYIEIRPTTMPFGRCRGCPDIEGRARVCEPGGVFDYDVSGDADNYRGTRFHVFMRRLVERESGLAPGTMQGEWSGDDIRATAELAQMGRTASATATRGEERASPPQVQYTLRRGTEQDFLTACRTQARRD